MDLKGKRAPELSSRSSSSMMSDASIYLDDNQPFSLFDSPNPCYDGTRAEPPFRQVCPPFDTQSRCSYRPEHDAKKQEHLESARSATPDWDPKVMLSNLSFLEKKIHQVQDIVRSIAGQKGQVSDRANDLVAQQQLVTADLTCIIIQLISTAGTLLPSVKDKILSMNPVIGQLGGVINSAASVGLKVDPKESAVVPPKVTKASEYDDLIKNLNNSCEGDELINWGEGNETIPIEDHDVKDSEDGVDGENLPPGSYEVLQLEKEEILAPHTHFCLICGKGFKRDANLRMHMRGHGDEYKTPAALAKPSKESGSEPMLIKRYSCPFLGCKRNKDHKKFQPLKTILCVKNHYKRSHCDKSYTCSRCHSKKFSVIADLKTHEKHCGRDKWLCSCGTTFSRKDKLFGHVALFQGHTPALPIDEAKVSGAPDQVHSKEVMAGFGCAGYNFAGSTAEDVSVLDIKGVDDDHGFFSPMNFDSCNFGGFDELTRPTFEVSEDPFSFQPGSSSFVHRDMENSSCNRLV